MYREKEIPQTKCCWSCPMQVTDEWGQTLNHRQANASPRICPAPWEARGERPASDRGGGMAEVDGDGVADSDVSLLQSLLRPAAECRTWSTSPGWPLRPPRSSLIWSIPPDQPSRSPQCTGSFLPREFCTCLSLCGENVSVCSASFTPSRASGLSLNVHFFREAFSVSPIQLGFPHLCTFQPCSPELLAQVIIMRLFF